MRRVSAEYCFNRKNLKFKISLIILGEISMQKVKVHRYISGKIPEYAKNLSSDESSEDEDFIEHKKNIVINKVKDPVARHEEERYEFNKNSINVSLLT